MLVSDGSHRTIEIFSRARAPVVAVNDGKVVRIGRSKRPGRYLTLRDGYGNIFTYGHLGEIARTHPPARPRAPPATIFSSRRPASTPRTSRPDR